MADPPVGRSFASTKQKPVLDKSLLSLAMFHAVANLGERIHESKEGEAR